jgi:hypothetical protein
VCTAYAEVIAPSGEWQCQGNRSAGPNSGKKVAGFSYAMGVFKRDGIKTVNGKALSK